MKLFQKKELNLDEAAATQKPPSRWLAWTSFSSVDFIGDLWDLLAAWRSNRQWRLILAGIPLVIVGLVLGAGVAIGKLSDKGAKLNWYANLAEKEIKLATEEPEGDSESSNGKSAKSMQDRGEFVDMLFRRVLMLNQSNKRAMYYVASQMSRYGKSAVARQMMESLAPSDFHGYDLAHAWLAANMIERAQRGEQTNVEVLTHHLKHATSRDDVNPALLIIYSQLLQREDRISEAEQILKKAAQFDPRLLLSSIATYNRNGLVGQAKSAADLLVETVKGKLTGEAGEDNRILTAQALVMTNRVDDGINVLQQGLVASGNSAKLRRALSDAFRIKFRSSLTNANSQVKVNLDLLNAAIVYDPTNIAVQEELGGLSNLGIGLNESSMNTLRAQIASGGTSFAARLLIAEASFRRGDIAGAVNQYEVVLAELPNMTLVLNNLSMMCTMLEPARLDDALSFIDRAVAISPQFPEFHDSRGEILVASNRKAEAIEEYLKALEMGPDRVATRKKLIALYEELGPADQLQLQRDKLKEVEEQLEAKQKQIEEAKRRQSEANPKPNPAPEASKEPADNTSPSTAEPQESEASKK